MHVVVLTVYILLMCYSSSVWLSSVQVTFRSVLYATKPELQVSHSGSKREKNLRLSTTFYISGRCVPYLLVAWFRSVSHECILLPLIFSDVALVC